MLRYIKHSIDFFFTLVDNYMSCGFMVTKSYIVVNFS